ncbi:MAG: hypothetical protein FWE11_04920 [Defluviitaleaceae bacterium]|nr:hypothetical protein [Defluviitaleaceae bacterium]
MKRIKNSFARGFHRVSEALRGTKTMYRRLKSLLILIFVALAIYQTGQLWFVNLSNRNFFLYLADRWNPSVAAGYREFVRPMRLVYGDGSGRFGISASGLMDTQQRAYFDTVLTAMFDRGNFIGSSETDFNRLLSRPMLLSEYAFLMPSHVFPLGFNQRTGGFLTSRGIVDFTKVVIWLPYENYDDLRVFFVSGDQTWEFTIDHNGLEIFPIHPVSTGSLYFVSAALEGYEGLDASTFVPRAGDLNRFASTTVVMTNPYRTQVGISLDFVGNQVAQFFDNPATINGRVAADGVWTYSNVHTTVRYFDTDVLEYASFRPRRQNATTSLMDDFSAAIAFIDEDNHVVNEFFLMDFECRGIGYVFWFGYIVDNFPILMPDGWRVSSHDDILTAPIEVVVEQGRVVLYRRLAHNFHINESGHRWINEWDLDFEGLLDEEEIVDLRLGYTLRPGLLTSPDDYLRLNLYAVPLEDE